MKKCAVFVCPNRADRQYLIDPETNIWLCGTCIELAQRQLRQEEATQKAIALTR